MPLPESAVLDTLRFVDLLGVLANAILGGVVARAARLDPIGFGFLAIVSGLGGGMIRDTLIQQGTPVAFTDSAYVLTALAGAAIAFLLPVEGRLWARVFPYADALALGAWAAAGSQKALAAGLDWLPAVLLGTITAVGGGLVRDVMLNRVPSIFGGNTLYATSALLASGVMVLFHQSGHATAGLVVTTVVGAGLTVAAQWRGWQLPDAYDWQGRLAVLARPHWRRRTR